MVNQLLLGAAIPFLLGALWYAFRRGHAGPKILIVLPLLMGLSSLWAVVPDLPRLFYPPLYRRLMLDPRCDIFFWHTTIDRMEKPSSWYMAGWIVLFILIISVALRELRRMEKPS